MRKFLLTPLIVALLMAGAAQASPAMYGYLWFDMTESELPVACNPGQLFVITDGDTADDCSTGGGSNIVFCVCDSGGASYTGWATRTAGQGLADNGVALDFSYSDTLAGNPQFAAEECVFTTDGAGGGGLLCEGTVGGGANANEQLFLFPATDGADTTEFIAVDTTSVTNIDGDGLAITAGQVDIKLLDAQDSTGGTSTRSGLEFGDTGSDELTILQGCGDNQVMKWDETGHVWGCEDDLTGGTVNSFETWNTDLGANPVADTATDTVDLTSAIAMTITGTDDTESVTWDFDYSNEKDATDIAMAVDECLLRADADGGGFVCEGSTADANEQEYLFPDVNGADTVDRIVVDDTQVTNVDGDGLTIGAGDLDVGAGTGIAVAADAVAFDFTDAGTDPTLSADEARFSSEGASDGGIVFEGATADTIETRIRVTDPTSADRIVTIPDANSATGVGITCTGDDKVSAFNASTGAFTCTTDQTGADNTFSINQATHGLSVGDAIHFNATTWEGADSDADKPCHGLVVAVADANNFTAAVSGVQTITAHGFTLGQNYITATAGAISTTAPGPGNVIQRVLVAIDTNTVIMTIGMPVT
jgi:hypothetical protein